MVALAFSSEERGGRVGAEEEQGLTWDLSIFRDGQAGKRWEMGKSRRKLNAVVWV